MSGFHNVKMDDSDPRFKKLKDTLFDEIKSRFNCENYEPIIK